jgi:hypothetical protein
MVRVKMYSDDDDDDNDDDDYNDNDSSEEELALNPLYATTYCVYHLL